jgi:hypothetical protein
MTCLWSFKRRLRRQCRRETETRRALELESALRQGAGRYPRCCADQKEEKGREADANTELKSIRKRKMGIGVQELLDCKS